MTHVLQPAPPRVSAQTCGAVSDRLVQLYRETYGRGPTRAKAFAANDMVITVMEDLLVPLERALGRSGGGELVRRGRERLRANRAQRFEAEVEQLTGRRVAKSIAAFGLDPEHVIEVFFLAD